MFPVDVLAQVHPSLCALPLHCNGTLDPSSQKHQHAFLPDNGISG